MWKDKQKIGGRNSDLPEAMSTPSVGLQLAAPDLCSETTVKLTPHTKPLS
jgi:hypothetical protein